MLGIEILKLIYIPLKIVFNTIPYLKSTYHKKILKLPRGLTSRDRLEAIKLIHIREGWEEGSSKRVHFDNRLHSRGGAIGIGNSLDKTNESKRIVSN